jgi:hypothetical protein
VVLSNKYITVQCDSNNSICLAKNPAFHVKKNHIDIPYHFFWDTIDDQKVIVEKVETLHNVVDALTKPLSIGNFKWFFAYMGLMAPSSELNSPLGS